MKTFEEQLRPLRMMRDWMLTEGLLEKDHIHPETLSAMVVISSMVNKVFVRKFGEQETIISFHVLFKMLNIVCLEFLFIWYSLLFFKLFYRSSILFSALFSPQIFSEMVIHFVVPKINLNKCLIKIIYEN